MKATVGDVLLFKISDKDFGVYAPLIVSSVNLDDGSVCGTLFFDWEKHRRLEWPSKKIFWGLSDLKWYSLVSGVKEGTAIGEWRFKEIATPVGKVSTPLKMGGKK